MTVNTEYQSPLKLKDLEITESQFSCSASEGENLSLELGVNREVEKIDDSTYKIVLYVQVADQEEKLRVRVKTVGVFETSPEFKGLIERNAISIMFPFVRSYISLITTQPSRPPIVLPPINVLKLLENNN